MLFYSSYSYNILSNVRNAKYLPIFNGIVIQWLSCLGFFPSRHARSSNVFLVIIQNTDFFIQISKMSIVSISSIE